jgi:hypothetical protein
MNAVDSGHGALLVFVESFDERSRAYEDPVIILFGRSGASLF